MTLFLMQVQLRKIQASHWSGYCGNYANPAKARPLIGQDIVAIMQILDFSNTSPTPTLLNGIFLEFLFFGGIFGFWGAPMGFLGGWGKAQNVFGVYSYI